MVVLPAEAAFGLEGPDLGNAVGSAFLTTGKTGDLQACESDKI